ncbi:MAG: uroporphyrinogen-III C-methyltransferase, partial [Gammaproteobacteria bacterium]|nr:uroporphyrinogen-III C-methyltransferase [Gammaproteobacteria bacterium]
IAMQLTELQDKVDQLPLNARTQPTHKNTQQFAAGDAPQLEGWAAVPGAVMETLKGLVVVSYNDKPIEPLLSAEQISNLHENLKLKLEQARLVLFRGDQKEYQANMDLAIAWAEKYFNTDEVATKKFVDTLNYLKSKQIDLKVPDISSSLRALRSVSKRMEINIPSMDNNAKLEDDSTNVAMN